MLVRSPFGHALAAARDNERRARSLGFPIFRLRLMAFVISGAIAGVAGYLAAAQFGYVAPQMLGWHVSATVLVMVLIGGLRSVAGPLVGAFVLLGLEECAEVGDRILEARRGSGRHRDRAGAAGRRAASADGGVRRAAESGG